MTRRETSPLVRPHVFVVDVKNEDVVKYVDVLKGFYCQVTSFQGVPFTGKFIGLETDDEGNLVGVALREFSTFDMKSWYVEEDRFLFPLKVRFVDGFVDARTMFHLPEPVIPEEYLYVVNQ